MQTGYLGKKRNSESWIVRQELLKKCLSEPTKFGSDEKADDDTEEIQTARKQWKPISLNEDYMSSFDQKSAKEPSVSKSVDLDKKFKDYEFADLDTSKTNPKTPTKAINITGKDSSSRPEAFRSKSFTAQGRNALFGAKNDFSYEGKHSFIQFSFFFQHQSQNLAS